MKLKFSDNNIGSDLCKEGNLNGIDHKLLSEFVHCINIIY